MFGDLIDEIKQKQSYKISYLRVAKYDYEQYLKTIENSTVTIQPKLNIELTDTDKKEVENIIQHSFQSIFISKNAIHGYVYNVDLEKKWKNKIFKFYYTNRGGYS